MFAFRSLALPGTCDTAAFPRPCSIVAGSLVLSGASVICYLVGASPLGGATLSLDSLAAAVTGIVAGAPFAGVRSVMWGKEVRTKASALLASRPCLCLRTAHRLPRNA